MISTYDCNLECEYCYVNKENIYLDQEKFIFIFKDIKSFCLYKKISNVNFFWIGGGEVLLSGIKVLGKALESCYNIFLNDNNFFSIKNYIQSNLVLYNFKWKNFLVKYFKNTITTSIDFPNIYRKAKSKNINEIILKRIKQIKKDDINLGIITTLNKKTLEVGAKKFYDFFFNNLKVKEIRLNLPFTPMNNSNSFFLDNKKLGIFLAELFKYWYENGYGKNIYIEPFYSLLSVFKNQYNSNNFDSVISWFTCNPLNRFCIDPYGNVGLCNGLVSNLKYFNYGNIFKNNLIKILENKKRKDFINRKEHILNSQCLDCGYCSICFGGCPIHAYLSNNCINSITYYCLAYKILFKEIEKTNINFLS